MRAKIIVLALLSFRAAGAQRPEILFDSEYGGYGSRALVSHQTVTISTLERWYQTHLSHLDETLILYVFRGEYDFVHGFDAQGHTDNDYASWLAKYYAEVNVQPINMGEIVKVGHDVLARTINAGRYEQKVLSGNDPLVCWPGSRNCRILWIDGGGVPPGQERRYKRPMIDLYIREQPVPDPVRAVAECYRLRRRFNTRLLFVSFRSDNWFIEDALFPVIFPFVADRHIGDLKAVRSAPEIGCVPLDNNTFRCIPVEAR